MVRALTVSGSLRRESYNTMLARLMARRLAGRGATVTGIDLNDFPLPLYNADLERDDNPETATRLAIMFAEADAVFIASPEYNGGISPVIKNAIDWMTRQRKGAFSRATFGLGAVSSGKLSGVVALTHLRDVLTKITALCATIDLRIGPAEGAFDADGELTEDAMRRRADDLADQLMTIRRR